MAFRLLDRVVDALAVLASVILCLLTVLVCVDVAARTFELFPLPWSLDVSEYALYVITFCGAPWVLRAGGHISIDLFVDQLSPTARRRTTTLARFLGGLVCLVLFYYSARVLYRSAAENTLVHETFVFPEWILMALAPPIFLILALLYGRALRTGRDDSPPDKPAEGF